MHCLLPANSPGLCSSGLSQISNGLLTCAAALSPACQLTWSPRPSAPVCSCSVWPSPSSPSTTCATCLPGVMSVLPAAPRGRVGEGVLTRAGRRPGSRPHRWRWCWVQTSRKVWTSFWALQVGAGFLTFTWSLEGNRKARESLWNSLNFVSPMNMRSCHGLVCSHFIGRFSEARLLEWMRFVIFCAGSRERSE